MKDTLPCDHLLIASFTCKCTMHGDQWLTPNHHSLIAELRENDLEFVTLKCDVCGILHKVEIDPKQKGMIMAIMNCEEKDEKQN